MQPLIVFATHIEAEATLALFKAKEVVTNTLYESECFQFLITGMGCLNAATQTRRYGASAGAIWNIGFAGGLHPTHELFEWHTVGFVGKEGETSVSLSGKSRLLSLDAPLHDEAIKLKLNPHWDLVDMEGFGVVQAAEALGKPVTLHKIVSDFCSKTTSETIREKAKELSVEISKKLKNQISA